jgi:hypothetical protein
LLLPALVALDLPGAVERARFPGTREVPALSSVLSLLALKAIGHRRVSHVDDVCTDPALAAFAGLESLPKASSLGSYSYRLTRAHDQALLAGLARAMTRTGQTHDADFDLDFHAIMHFGGERHKVCVRRDRKRRPCLQPEKRRLIVSELVLACMAPTASLQASRRRPRRAPAEALGISARSSLRPRSLT